MKQGFLSPGLTYPFLMSTGADSVDLTRKSDIYPIMKGLQGFPAKYASKIIVSRGSNGIFPGTHGLQSFSEAGAPGTAAEGTSLVLIGDPTALEPSPYKKDTQTEVSHRHATGEKGGLRTRWGCT